MDNNLQKTATFITLPFTFLPQFFFLRKAGLGAGALVLIGAIAVAVYFAGAAGIQRFSGNKSVMKTAFIIWIIGSVIAAIYLIPKNAGEAQTTPVNPSKKA